jgi:hypothetical protein
MHQVTESLLNHRDQQESYEREKHTEGINFDVNICGGC